MGRRQKRDREVATSSEVEDRKEIPNNKRVRKPRAQRAERPNMEPEYIPEKRNLEDLWQAAFPVGTEWDNMDQLKEIDWNFSNLEKAFEEGGDLYGKTVYMFGSTEPPPEVNGEEKVTLIPVVVVVVSPIPPSDKIGVNSVQRETEEIISMKSMKMAWIPYIPLEKRQSQVERLKTQIYTIGCTQRRSALQNLNIEHIKKYDYCLPYIQPLKADEDEEDTVVNIIYPSEPPAVCHFDWGLDELEEFTDELVKEEALAEDQKEAFKVYVKEQIRERKKAQRQTKGARRKAIEDMNPETKAALENMQFYKFYPVQTPDTHDIKKVAHINRYYGKAHFLL